MYRERRPALKTIFLLIIFVVGMSVLLHSITTDDNIDSTIIAKKGNYDKVSTLKGISQEKVIELIKTDEEYISKENDKNEKINDIKENSYFAKLKKSNILRENNTIDTSKQFNIIKFVNDENTISHTIKSMPTKQLIDRFNQMNDLDRISTILTIMSRNEFKGEYIAQLESANTSILKEENKTKVEIEKIEKPFNEKFDQTVEKELQTLEKIRKYSIVAVISWLLFMACLLSWIIG